MEDKEMIKTLEKVEGEEQEKMKQNERLKRAGKQAGAELCQAQFKLFK